MGVAAGQGEALLDQDEGLVRSPASATGWFRRITAGRPDRRHGRPHRSPPRPPCTPWPNGVGWVATGLAGHLRNGCTDASRPVRDANPQPDNAPGCLRRTLTAVSARTAPIWTANR